MSFQSSVRRVLAGAIVGDIILDGPQRAVPAILDSTDPLKNVIGRAFFRKAGEDLKVSAEGANTLVFAGILSNSKLYALNGSSLAPSITLENAKEVQLLQMGYVVVSLLTAGNIGDAIFASDTTGELRVGAAAGFTAVPNATVAYQNTAGAGLAIIKLTN